MPGLVKVTPAGDYYFTVVVANNANRTWPIGPYQQSGTPGTTAPAGAITGGGVPLVVTRVVPLFAGENLELFDGRADGTAVNLLSDGTVLAPTAAGEIDSALSQGVPLQLTSLQGLSARAQGAGSGRWLVYFRLL